MIRGPVLPQSREALWSLVVGRLDAIERGLKLVFEGFDCSDGQLGPAEGLARDAGGSPVLLLLAVEGDVLLAARALAAVDFLRRVGDALGPAVPEASFCVGGRGRVLVIAVERHASSCDLLVRQSLPDLQVCRLEPFRVAGTERFAVRWLSAAGPAVPAGVPEVAFAVPGHLQAIWSWLQEVCSRIDAGVKLDGDRFRRRITWNGQWLAEVHVVDGALFGIAADGVRHALMAASDARAFADLLLRSYAQLAGLPTARATESGGAASGRDAAARTAAKGGVGGSRGATGSLRSIAAAARLTPEEYSALGGPASEAGGETEGVAMAEDMRGVAADEISWPLPGRSD